MNLTVPFLNFLYPIFIRIGLLTDSNLPTYLSQNGPRRVRSAALHTVYSYGFFQTSNLNIIFISSQKRGLRRKRKTINTRFLVCSQTLKLVRIDITRSIVFFFVFHFCVISDSKFQAPSNHVF
jgi:hypothetical protein